MSDCSRIIKSQTIYFQTPLVSPRSELSVNVIYKTVSLGAKQGNVKPIDQSLAKMTSAV